MAEYAESVFCFVIEGNEIAKFHIVPLEEWWGIWRSNCFVYVSDTAYVVSWHSII